MGGSTCLSLTLLLNAELGAFKSICRCKKRVKGSNGSLTWDKHERERKELHSDRVRAHARARACVHWVIYPVPRWPQHHSGVHKNQIIEKPQPHLFSPLGSFQPLPACK